MLDMLFAGCGLVALAPVIAGVAIAIRVSMGAPVFFRQQRPGLHAKPFELLKFRSMLHEVGPNGQTLTQDQRVTRLGSFLRRTSLDELPELWNILKGDMSLVGPRPLLMEYLPRYSSDQARRHEVKPGLTGLAQINGRHLLDWESRFALDVWYVDNWSLRVDLAILRSTAKFILDGEGSPDPTVQEYEFGVRHPES
jgi:lipopolysaccharide/colanic/teichoic acid biosynthesis glycosyltransferase